MSNSLETTVVHFHGNHFLDAKHKEQNCTTILLKKIAWLYRFYLEIHSGIQL